jgi:intron-binding protein aquarius
VRTKAVGHLRDVRRLVVAMSRARLGLYVFGRAALFKNCYELASTFTQLLARPTKLCIVPGETYPTERPVASASATAVQPLVIEDVMHMGRVVDQMARLAIQTQQTQYHRDLLAYQTQLKALEAQQRSEAASSSSSSSSEVEDGEQTMKLAAMHAATTVAAEIGALADGNDEDDDEDDQDGMSDDEQSSSKKRKSQKSKSNDDDDDDEARDY